MKTLRLLLGDQLNIRHSWFGTADSAVIYCMFEMRQETDYAEHHIQKAAAFFAAMRAFAKTLEDAGHKVIYLRLDDKRNKQTLTANLGMLLEETGAQRFEYQFPDEYRLDAQLADWCKQATIETQAFDTEHFYTARTDLADFFKEKNQLLMESFYRHMRKKHNILMAGPNPEGGQWNFDHDNRNKWDAKDAVPKKPDFAHDVRDILKLLKESRIKTMGNEGSGYLNQPLTRKEALSLLKFFCEKLLRHFGDYQDAMHTDEVLLFHSNLSFAMNVKLISPKDVVITVTNFYHKHAKDIAINEVEGFVRQIIGWREYMRGIYWMRMPDFAKENHFGNKNPLPYFYWDAKTKMKCLHHCIANSLDNAYAHHIQRLMVLGNFALLMQADPDDVDRWYLGVYVDAVEWVQLPNTRGMSQYADGGKLATKPYISSGNYINKMSNYCKECTYTPKKRIDNDACPFNALYWNFLHEKQQQLGLNPRMAFMYKQLEKIKPDEMEAIIMRAEAIMKDPGAF